ncbi:hypothetical protein DFJ74DRAFT_684614 [Hyaloraphidium curvatum]|nr:hypothetical protein DFJ74DRAFT_684614 [Hyaloraphidium curvatum]
MANTTSSAVVGAMAGMPAHLLGDSLWARIGRGFLNFTKPVFEKLGGVGTHTAFTFAVFWTSYIAMYNFYTAVDKHNLWGLQKYKIHPGKMEPQELNDKVVDGMKSGFWKGAVRMAAAYGVFFSFGRQPVFSFPKSPLSLLGNLVIGYFIFDFGFYWCVLPDLGGGRGLTAPASS